MGEHMKCRANWAIARDSGLSSWSYTFTYKREQVAHFNTSHETRFAYTGKWRGGDRVAWDRAFLLPRVCAAGIHFFQTKREAQRWARS